MWCPSIRKRRNPAARSTSISKRTLSRRELVNILVSKDLFAMRTHEQTGETS
jgi:hypothetical protein